MSYNGWENWDTWECYLILSNDEGGLELAASLTDDQEAFTEWLADYVRQANWDHRDSVCFGDVDVAEIIAMLQEE